jgi:hypothetical protein
MPFQGHRINETSCRDSTATPWSCEKANLTMPEQDVRPVTVMCGRAYVWQAAEVAGRERSRIPGRARRLRGSSAKYELVRHHL